MPAACYLIFQLYTHSWLYVPRATPDPLHPSPSTAAQLLLYADGPQPPTEGKVFRIPSLPSWGGGGSSTSGGSSGASASSRGESLRVRSRSVSGEEDEGEADQATAGDELSHSAIHPVATTTSTADVDLEKQGAASAPATEHEEPKLGVWFALGLLVVVTSLTVRSRFHSTLRTSQTCVSAGTTDELRDVRAGRHGRVPRWLHRRVDGDGQRQQRVCRVRPTSTSTFASYAGILPLRGTLLSFAVES